MKISIVLKTNITLFNCSEVQFNRIEEAINKETGNFVEMSKTVEILKANLMDKFSQKFKNNWGELELSQSLAILEFSKLQNKSEEKKWRPTALSAEEQILPSIEKKLLKKKNYLKTQCVHQSRLTAELIPQVEQYRSGFKKLAEKNKQIQCQIEADRLHLQQAEKAIDFVQSELTEKTSFENFREQNE